MLPTYPETTELTLALRPLLHPLLRQLQQGISEFTFANLYLFRKSHHYTLSLLPDGTLTILGRDDATPFFMLPFELPAPPLLDQMFRDHGMMKGASREQAEILRKMGYAVREDRDNFDYLYRRQDLAELGGRNFHKKRNLVKAFVSSNIYTALPLLDEHRGDALGILEEWKIETQQTGDAVAAREALEKMEELQLCGGIYYVQSRPVALVLGEELARGACFAIHFEKAVSGYKGLYQFINQSFASILPEFYETINREQDMGDAGLRQAKLSYQPTGFVEKFKINPAATLPR
jgi:hypothetical protein